MISEHERCRRYEALRQGMKAEGYRALLLAGNAEATQRGYIRYVSDWRLWGGNGYVVFPLEEDPTLVLGVGSQSYWAQAVGWIQDVRATEAKIAEAVRVLTAGGLSGAKIGAVGMDHIMSYRDVKSLMASLPDALIVDATDLVDGVMAIKSQEEIAHASETYESVAQALRLVKGYLAPGKTERQVMAEAVHFLARRGCLDGIAHISNEAPPFIRPPRDRRIEADDVIKVSLEFAGPAGYWIELAGVFSFRQPTERQRRHFATTLRAVEGAAALMRPGNTAGDLSRAIEETYRQDGWNITGRAIWDVHSIGLNVIRPPIGLPESLDELQENMILNIHPGLLVDADRWGVYVQDNLLVTPDGGRPLGDYKYEWHVLSA